VPSRSFPRFKELVSSDRQSIERLTAAFPPYSDYTFASLLSWNTGSAVEWSVLRDNLAVRFNGYVPDQLPFYSLLGTTEVDAAVAELLALGAGADGDSALRLVPAVVVEQINDRGRYRIEEDPDHHDYVFRTSDLVDCAGAGFAAKRKRVNRFLRSHGRATHVATLDLADHQTGRDMVAVFAAWEQSRSLEREHTGDELDAIQRLLRSAPDLDLIGVGVFVEGGLKAFSILEVSGDFGVAHFEKADVSYVGIFPFLKQQVATKLRELGCEFVNYEQDLGLPGLRREKRSWRPALYLKKYVVSPAPAF
jgi:hypothetical protein